ncbi:hypothetical protein EDC96DRAFT_248649 [Choanephora cucurbitarum]|nr:hypothetical protein EDC96DRAFT_248649 [Choanephora cucurbitarum]
MDKFPEIENFYIVMDNTPIHTSDNIKNLIEARDYREKTDDLTELILSKFSKKTKMGDSLRKGKQKTSKSSKWGTRFFSINETSEVIGMTLALKKNDFSFTVLNTSFWHDFRAI